MPITSSLLTLPPIPILMLRLTALHWEIPKVNKRVVSACFLTSSIHALVSGTSPSYSEWMSMHEMQQSVSTVNKKICRGMPSLCRSLNIDFRVLKISVPPKSAAIDWMCAVASVSVFALYATLPCWNSAWCVVPNPIYESLLVLLCISYLVTILNSVPSQSDLTNTCMQFFT
jgi:hypothetical protein